jgi:integrase
MVERSTDAAGTAKTGHNAFVVRRITGGDDFAGHDGGGGEKLGLRGICRRDGANSHNLESHRYDRPRTRNARPTDPSGSTRGLRQGSGWMDGPCVVARMRREMLGWWRLPYRTIIAVITPGHSADPEYYLVNGSIVAIDPLLAEQEVTPSRIEPSPLHLAAGTLTVRELAEKYLTWADERYRKDGRPTGQICKVRAPAALLVEKIGDLPATEVRPQHLRQLVQEMVERRLARSSINAYLSITKAIFRWGSGQHEDLIPPSVYEALRVVTGLRRGQSRAKERPPVRPVPDEHVEAIRQFVSPTVWAMVQIQRLSGMRSGDVVLIRTCDIDASETVWTYVPSRHKTEHHGHERVVYLGPAAQRVLRHWLDHDNPGGFVFCPNGDPSKHYRVDSYRRAIQRACKRAGVPTWFPHQLRHSLATKVRRDFGLEAAQIILGHQSLDVTQIYAERNVRTAMHVIAEIG